MRSLPVLVATLTLLVALALPATTAAGGWVVVTLDALPQAATTGQELTIGFMVRQHGQTPLAGERPTLTFQHGATGEQITVTAREEGPRGHYVAQVTLPQPGAWQWAVEVWQHHPMPALEVRPGTVASAGATPTGAPAWLPLAGAAALTLLAALLLGLSWRLRNAPARPAQAG